LGAADLKIVNLEGWITGRQSTVERPFAGGKYFVRALRAAGIDIVSVANNHAFDGGIEGFDETCRVCHGEGLSLLGLRGSGGFYSQPVILNRDGLRIGLLAYTWIRSFNLGQPDRDESDRVAVILDGLVNYTWDRTPDVDRERRCRPYSANEYVFKDVSKLREQVDIVAVVAHWGYEWTVFPPLGVVLEAESFFDGGVDLVIGVHPHIVQGVLERPGKLCAFSLGNLIFDGSPRRSRHSALLDVEIGKNGVERWEMHPLWLGEGKEVRLATGRRERRIREQVARSSAAVALPDRANALDDEIIYAQSERGYRLNKTRKVFFLLLASLVRPSLFPVIISKVGNFIEIVKMRMRGHRVRW
jgi:poly-gamma-glutamate synthesis protein (capsule biosynthesis protein)